MDILEVYEEEDDSEFRAEIVPEGGGYRASLLFLYHEYGPVWRTCEAWGETRQEAVDKLRVAADGFGHEQLDPSRIRPLINKLDSLILED